MQTQEIIMKLRANISHTRPNADISVDSLHEYAKRILWASQTKGMLEKVEALAVEIAERKNEPVLPTLSGSKLLNAAIDSAAARIIKRYDSGINEAPDMALAARSNVFSHLKSQGLLQKLMYDFRIARNCRTVSEGRFQKGKDGIPENILTLLITAHELGKIDLLDPVDYALCLNTITAKYPAAKYMERTMKVPPARMHLSERPAANKLAVVMFKDEEDSLTLPYREGYWQR